VTGQADKDPGRLFHRQLIIFSSPGDVITGLCCMVAK
jgi:hypothetical protein